MNKNIKLLLLGIIILVYQVSGLYAGEPKKAAVFLSDTIKPYYEAAQGLETELKNNKINVKVIEIKNLDLMEFRSICQDLIKEGYVYWAGIGPLAMNKIYDYHLPEVAGRVYSMVLAPEKIVNQGDTLCGVSLKISVEEQVRQLIQVFSPAVRPGIIYDPEYNSLFAEQAFLGFQKYNIKLKLLKVNSKADVPDVLSRGIKNVNLLWMIPDQTVISESLIRYIIKNSIKQGIGVVGYNRFFLKQGAAASFVINYGKVGIQTARILIELMHRNTCRSSDPSFELNVNEALIEMLNLNKEP